MLLSHFLCIWLWIYLRAAAQPNFFHDDLSDTFFDDSGHPSSDSYASAPTTWNGIWSDDLATRSSELFVDRENGICVEGTTYIEPADECSTCMLGHYCPEGTSSVNGHYLENLCSSRYYCPTPWEIQRCPLGYFCDRGQASPYLCPIGTHCPAMTKTAELCPEGRLCQNATANVPCPGGHYCPEGSIEAIRCPIITLCPEGSAVPDYRYNIILACIALGIMLIVLVGILYCKTGLNNTADKSRLSLRHKHNRIDTADEIDAFSSFKTKETATISFDNITLKLKGGDKKVIVNNASGVFPHSSLIAVMGPSGTGKTSLVNAITGKHAYYGTRTGSVKINGHEQDFANLRSEVGFVPQEDIVNEVLTVRDNLFYSARLRLPASTTRNEIIETVDAIVEMLGLERVQHTVVGSASQKGISGGQKKRVNIGMELVSKPNVLFLDEPTSGLDATTTLEVLHSLKTIARLGVTTVTILHQPRYQAFLQFDYVVLLGPGGCPVYSGPAMDSRAYFQHIGFTCPEGENPADFFMDVISGQISRDGEFAHADPTILAGLWAKHKDDNYATKITKPQDVQLTKSKDTRDDKDAKDASTGQFLGLPPRSMVKSSQRLWTPNGFIERVELHDKTVHHRKIATICLPSHPNISQPPCSDMFSLHEKADSTNQIPLRIRPSTCVQLRIMLSREFWRMYRQLKQLVQEGLVITLVGLGVGLMYVGGVDISRAPELGMVTSLFLGLFGTLLNMRLILSEKLLMYREASAGVSPHAYFLAKIIVNLILSFWHTTLFLLFASPLLNITEYELWSFCWLVYFQSSGLGIMASVFVNAPEVPFGVLSAIIGTFFAGVLTLLPEMGSFMYTFSAISHSRWFAEALFYIVASVLPPHLEDLYVEDLEEQLGYDHRMSGATIALLLMGCIYRLIAYLGILFYERDRKL